VNGALKETFTSLKELRIRIKDNESHEQASNWIKFCLIVYNIIMPLDNYTPTTDCGTTVGVDEGEDLIDEEEENQSGVQKRIELCNWVLNMH